jgi:hypothetical protein
MVLVSRCWLCESDGESVDHLLLRCGAARALWNAFFNRFGLCWVMPCSVKELLASWWSGGCSRSAVVWKMVPLCIMWCIWSERNNRCFEDSSRSIEELLNFFLFTLFPGQRAGPTGDGLSFVYPLCTGCAPLRFLINFLTYQKKKKRFPPCLNFYLYVSLFAFSAAFLCILPVY